ncbi:MAG TPA: adenylate/guanylate cyclase domain-containing protein, partial [Spirochaetota bacterium]|nr:adenylate/guanylate cyclase domain-containing protein [Spirochaetota bacterium]
PIDFGIGINTGDVVLGTVGSDTRMDTTVIGDTVNMSERMEELTKIYKVPIIISENSFNALEKSDEFCIRKIDKVKFLGKTIPITVYEVFDCDDDRIKDMKRNMFNQFNEAIDLYLLGKFNDAYKLLNEYVKIFPHDAVANLYVKRLGLLMDKSVKQWPGYTVVR